jgi:hypothetical protein
LSFLSEIYNSKINEIDASGFFVFMIKFEIFSGEANVRLKRRIRPNEWYKFTLFAFNLKLGCRRLEQNRIERKILVKKMLECQFYKKCEIRSTYPPKAKC